ncbi:MAG: hypothetical protein AB4368_02615 [Xenococcaceae cyanobacterium]
MNKKNLAKKVLGTLAILASIAFLSSPAHAGCNRNEREDKIRNKYNGLVSFAPGQYNAFQVIPIAVETYFNGGSISQKWAKEELKRISIRAAEFLARNNFDPSKDELIGDVMTFNCYERPFLPFKDVKVEGANIFVPYIAIRRSGQPKPNIALSNYQRFKLQTGTALHKTDSKFDFEVLPNGDLMAIKKQGQNSTEVHILDN